MTDPASEIDLEHFRNAFRALTGNEPFPWQEDLYLRFFSRGEFPIACDIPTGLGKTSVIAIWLIALATHPERGMPRRLVYVVNRRTVVDQTTNEAEKLRKNLRTAGLFESLEALCALPLENDRHPLAISTLRGEFADNREWSADPARPAVIVGTVDMVGSRLLFSGYGVGFKLKPLHAGFLAQDVLLVHDEAHLEPAFDHLLTSIREEQERCSEFRRLHIMALSATSRRIAASPFGLTDREKSPPPTAPDPPTEPLHIVWRRLTARKGIKFHSVENDKVAETIASLALRHKDGGKSVVVFVRRVDDVENVIRILTKKGDGVPASQVQSLTGTLRGFERDDLVRKDPIFQRFLTGKQSTPEGQTTYLVCTSAGEIGIDISADHTVCDLTPLDSMIQRLGRVNRRGEVEAEVDIVHEPEPNPKGKEGAAEGDSGVESRSGSKEKDDPLEKARWMTLEVLKDLPLCGWDGHRRDASPLALRELNSTADSEKLLGTFTPEPVILPTSDILFDSWALTTIRGKLPGRPPVEPYLHGLASWEPPETSVAWREEVGLIADDLLQQYNPEDLLEDYPLKPHELLRDRSDRVFKQIQRIAKRRPNAPVWIVGEDDSVEPTALSALNEKSQVENCTVLLPPCAGGLHRGFLDGDSVEANDVSDEWRGSEGRQRRARIWDDAPVPEAMRVIRTIDTRPDMDDSEGGEEPALAKRFWRWCEAPRGADGDGSKRSRKPVALDVHVGDVVHNAKQIVARLPLSEDFRKTVILAATFHDLGKRRTLFQRILGNRTSILLAKSGDKRQARGLAEAYRHEFGSLLDAQAEAQFSSLDSEMRDLLLHLIAAHHGRARPHFPVDEAFDPEPNGRDMDGAAGETPRRFARLQKKYGRWGLAYFESLLRAADYAASAHPSEFLEDDA